MSVPQKQCPSCGTVTALDAVGCPGCGHQFRTQFTMPPLDQTQLMPPHAGQPWGQQPPGYPPQYPPPGYPPSPYPPGVAPGYPPMQTLPYTGKEKIPAGLLAIFLGPLGIHLFYLNMPGWGVGYLLVSILTCGWGTLLTGTVSLVQGILYLCANDYDFQVKYAIGKQLF